MLNRNCPNCASTNAMIHTSPEVFPNEENLAECWSGFLCRKSFFPYYRCECGMLYCKEYPDLDKLNILYSSMSDNEHSGDPESEGKTKSFYVDDFLSRLNSSHMENVLEIGADNGRFAHRINELCKVENYFCVEPNKLVHTKLNQVNNARVFETIDQALASNIKFDAIIGIHVFDHIPDIRPVLKNLYLALNKGGGIYAVVHNEQSLMAKALGVRWPAFCMQHPHLFNETTIKQLFELEGFKNSSLKRTKNYFPAGYLMHHFLLAVLGKYIEFPSLFNIGLKLGNISYYGEK